MKLNDLKLFCAVMHCGNLTQAAHKLGLSQPGLSRSIRQIESALKTPLFIRHGRGLLPTEAGQRFYQFAQQTQHAYDQLQQDLLQWQHQPETTIRMVVPFGTGHLLIPALLKRLNKTHPALKLHLYEETPLVALQRLQSHELDIALVYQPPITEHAHPVVLAKEHLYLVGVRRLMPDGDVIRLAEAAGLPLLLPSPPSAFRRFIERSFQQAGYSIHVVQELELVEVLLSFARTGEGFALLSRSNILPALEQDHQLVASVIIDPPIQRKLSWLSRSGLQHAFEQSLLKEAGYVLRQVAEQADFRDIEA